MEAYLMKTEIKTLISRTTEFARSIYGEEFVPLHQPIFEGNEKQYLSQCIDSNFVSSVGVKVTEFEQEVAKFTGAKFAVATVSGTAALHVALEAAGVVMDDEVITQALTFVATSNAICYVGAKPVFVDVDIDTLGLSPEALSSFLIEHAFKKGGETYNKKTGRRISACVPMHTFGMPCRIMEIASICSEWGIHLIEDCAESLGSYVKSQHTGTFGEAAIFSFNGNKIITTGGGGMVITNDEKLAQMVKHKTTTSKIPHPFEFVHDEVGYNYRMPNLNAALGCAQIEKLNDILLAKQTIAKKWQVFFSENNVDFPTPISGSTSNNWLNSLILHNKSERDAFLNGMNNNGIMTRPIWQLMPKLEMFSTCQTDTLQNSMWLADRVVNVPSSVPNKTN